MYPLLTGNIGRRMMITVVRLFTVVCVPWSTRTGAGSLPTGRLGFRLIGPSRFRTPDCRDARLLPPIALGWAKVFGSGDAPCGPPTAASNVASNRARFAGGSPMSSGKYCEPVTPNTLLYVPGDSHSMGSAIAVISILVFL